MIHLVLIMKFKLQQPVWIPASSTNARYVVPSDLGYGSGKPAYLPATLIQNDSDGVCGMFQLEWDSTIKLKINFNDVSIRNKTPSVSDNIISMNDINEGNILASLGQRFLETKFVSSIGRHFLALNPLNKYEY